MSKNVTKTQLRTFAGGSASIEGQSCLFYFKMSFCLLNTNWLKCTSAELIQFCQTAFVSYRIPQIYCTAKAAVIWSYIVFAIDWFRWFWTCRWKFVIVQRRRNQGTCGGPPFQGAGENNRLF